MDKQQWHSSMCYLLWLSGFGSVEYHWLVRRSLGRACNVSEDRKGYLGRRGNVLFFPGVIPVNKFFYCIIGFFFCRWCVPQSPLEWASINRMWDSLFIIRYPNRWKDTTKKLAGPAETVSIPLANSITRTGMPLESKASLIVINNCLFYLSHVLSIHNIIDFNRLHRLCSHLEYTLDCSVETC